MANKIAVVKLAQGEIGFFDEASGMYLNLINPVGEIYDNTNTSKIKQAIINKQLELVSGTLIPVTTVVGNIDKFKSSH